jgi:F-type H+-transporting ATPase subunit a
MLIVNDNQEKKSGWRWGVNRWIVLALIIASVVFTGIYAPLRPHIALPAEPVIETPLFTLPVIGAFYFTNTMTVILISDVLLLLMAYGVYRSVKSGNLVPKGFSGAIEALLEALYNMTEGTAGKWAKTIFPWFASITLLVLLANWAELIPGIDALGWFNPHHVANFEEICTQTQIGPFVAIGATVSGPEANECAGAIIPWFRSTSTDLNFTLSLALAAVIAVQVIGVRAQGASYFTKFWNTKTFFSKPIFGVIDFVVGFLELISEFSKILSFTFRLFGNIFAGSVLLFVMGSLLSRVAFFQVAFLMLEFFVGLIQALVFGLLTMTFMAQATQGHGEHEEVHA